jgi:Leucine-rich repeat (LRR) protein
MSIINIQHYFDSLPDDIEKITIVDKNITYLPDLSRFTKLKYLSCYNNQLTSLPTLPLNLVTLHCSNNQLTSLPTLPINLQYLYCYSNQLTSLPCLPLNLQYLYCYNNQLTSLPTLPLNLITLYCSFNKLTSLPCLPLNLQYLYCQKNPIYKIIKNDNIIILKLNVNKFNKFRYFYYSLKYKNKFRKLLWEKVREPKIRLEFAPDNILDILYNEIEDDIIF